MNTKSRNVSSKEKARVLNYCEFVVLLVAACLVNIKLAVALLLLSPAIIMLIVGIKEKNFHFFQDEYNEKKELIKKDICA